MSAAVVRASEARSIVKWIAALVATTAVAIAVGRAVIPVQYASPSFICFWSGAELLAKGESPYDAVAQERVQRAQGWDKATDGYGFWDFLPYYYPPSILMPVTIALLPLGYPTARIAWLVLNVEWLVLSGLLLRGAGTGVARWIPMVSVLLFAPSVFAVLVGQLTPLVLLAVVAVWRLLQGRRDRSAGVLLAWMVMKPQLIGVFVAAVLLWAWRRGRRGVLAGAVAGGLVLVALMTLAVPSWPADLLHALGAVPLPTVERPWVGATWLLFLRTVGVQGPALVVCYLAAAVPLLAATWRAAWNPARPLDEVVAASMLTAFFVAPYARAYDFPLLVIPLLILLGGRLPAVWTVAFPTLFLLVPLVHLWRLTAGGRGAGFTFIPQVWLFWIPALLAVAWLATERRVLRSERA